MPAMQNANTVALQLEKVRDKVPLLYERDDILLTMIQQRGDLEKVSSRAMRLPFQILPGGKAGGYNADGGQLLRGSGTQYDVGTITALPFHIALEITKLVQYATTGSERAVENAAKREVANGMKQLRSFLDKILNGGPGNGVIGTVSSVSGTTLTMSVPNGAALVYIGQPIRVYDPTLTIDRNAALGASSNVLEADPITSGAQTITLDVVPAGTAAGDLILYDIAAGASPGANPVGLFNLKYHQNNATTGTWMNLNRATYPVQLQTPRVNAANSALVPTFARLAYNKVRKALGINSLEKVIAYMAVEQEHAWENLGIGISQIIKEGGAGGGADDLDLLFTGKKTIGGMPIKASVNADQTRIDFVALPHWGRAVLKDIDFFEINNITVFPLYGANGAPAASYWFAFDTHFNIWDDSPRSGAFIDTLARPAGY